MRVPRVIASLTNLIQTKNNTSLIGESVVLCSEESHHLKEVLRLSSGDKIEILFRENKIAFTAIISEIDEKNVTAKIEKEIELIELPSIHLIFPIIKNSRLEIMIEKVVELGCHSITFFEASHSRPGAKAGHLQKKLPRLNKIKEQALKQSRSGVDTKLIIHEDFKAISLSSDVKKIALLSPKDSKHLIRPSNYSTFFSLVSEYVGIKKNNDNADLYIMVGPEAGFSKVEIRLLEEQSFTPASFGPNILRAETAAISAVAIARELLMCD